jgi:hypothetical protein
MNKHWIYGAVLGISVLVSACGGGSGSSASGSTATGGGSEPGASTAAQMADAFTKVVAAIVASFSDTAEPSALDNAPPTEPENLEPVSVS